MNSTNLFGTVALAIASLYAAAPATAGELDRAVSSAPQGLIVRVDASGNREVFKAELSAPVASDAVAAKVAAQFATEANRVSSLAPASELDRSSSSEAWYYWPSSSYLGGYSYSYWSYGYSWNYYPCYSWNWSNYSYYYYYWR